VVFFSHEFIFKIEGSMDNISEQRSEYKAYTEDELQKLVELFMRKNIY
jgi:hypothetical protein